MRISDAAYTEIGFQAYEGSEYSPNIYGEPASIRVIRYRPYRVCEFAALEVVQSFPSGEDLEDIDF